MGNEVENRPFNVDQFIAVAMGEKYFTPASDVVEEDLSDVEQKNRFLEDTRRAVLNILEDISASEAHLKNQTAELQKFRLAADKSFNHIVITDADGFILYANEAAERLTGFTFDEMSGKTPSLWGRQMSLAFYVELWRVIKTEKKPFIGEITNKKKDGSLYVATARIIPILDDKEEVKFFVATEDDITEERRQRQKEKAHAIELEKASKKIQEEKDRAEGILYFLRSIGEGVFATDKDGIIVFSNMAAAEMVGSAPDKVMGKKSQEIFRFCASESDEFCDFFPSDEAIRNKKTMAFGAKTFLIASEDSRIPVSGTLSPIIDENGISGAIVVFQNITERYELEQMKERFLSVAAHQLRTPLGSMRWSMELLEGGDLGELPPQAKEAVTELHKNSDRMMMLVNDLLSVSRMSQTEVKEKSAPVALADIVTEVLSALHGDAEKKSIHIEVKAPKKALPMISVIRKHVFEAIENVVSNAVRYGKEGGNVQISMSLKKDHVVLVISDDGIGIPKKDQSNIFAKFFRAENAVKFFTDGSGLGLSVVKSYIEESNGEISFESEENVGTTFTIKFPLNQDKQ